MGIGSIAFIDFLANFNYTSADFAHQWVLNDRIREKSLGWKNKINNNKELTVGINFNNAEPLNTQLGITNQQVYDEINAAINLWQRWPEMTCADKEIDLKITIKEVNGGSGVGRCLLENSFDNDLFKANLDIYIPGNYVYFGQCNICLVPKSFLLSPYVSFSPFT